MRRGFVLFGDGKFFKCINRKKVAHGAVSFVGWGVWVFSQGYVFASVFVSGFDQLLELVQQKKFRQLKEILSNMNEVDIAEFVEDQEPEKKAKKKEKKEKGITFTREQVEKMELAVKQLESVKDQFTRLTAEYDNYRKRTTKEKDGIYQDAKGDTIKTFLSVYDNLERAAAAEGGEDDPHKKGLEMIFHQFKELLAKEGVKEIEAKGKEFDPELMDAVMHIEDESLGENVVAQVFQAGFELNGKVLRHAIVQVAN